jgi:hypothetical protein
MRIQNLRVKERILVKTRTQKSKMSLPKEVCEHLQRLELKERKAYAILLRNAGWTLQAIATPLELSRESIRLYTLSTVSDETLEAVKELPMPQVPVISIYADRVKYLEPSADVIAQLLTLKKTASLVRAKSKKHREDAEQYTKLIYETLQSGVSIYRLSKLLGVTHGAINSRLVRYGYTTTTGKSYAYTILKYREIGE